MSRAYTASRVPFTDSTVAFETSRAEVSAVAAATEGVSVDSEIGLDCATDVDSVRPAASVTTTKSPPYTGRPWKVREYGTYCRPSLDFCTLC